MGNRLFHGVVGLVLVFGLQVPFSLAAPAPTPACDGEFKIAVRADVTDEFVLGKREALKAAGGFADPEACHEAIVSVLGNLPEPSQKIAQEGVLCACNGVLSEPKEAPPEAHVEASVPTPPPPTDEPEPAEPAMDPPVEAVPEAESCGCDATGAGVWTWALLVPWMRRRRT